MTIHCGSFCLPESPLLSLRARNLLREQQREINNKNAISAPTEAAQSAKIDSDFRQVERERFYSSDEYQDLLRTYDVRIETSTIAGTVVEIFSPTGGVSEENNNKIAVNFHGGSFQSGSRTASHLESIPVAALGKIIVISVDYRLYPEYRHPAATDDAEAVYTSLLESYSSTDIALFGSSSGAQLIAQLMVRLHLKNLPRPAAIAMLAEGATQHNVGDSIAMAGNLMAAKMGVKLDELIAMPYFEHADQNDPTLCPMLSDTFMAAFPPTLLASSSRDIWLSPVIATHRQLQRLGVEAELQLWEGLEHCFHYNHKLPEAKELHQLMLRFLLRHLH